MIQKSGPPPIVYILIALAVLGGGYYFFFHQSDTQSAKNLTSTPQTTTSESSPSTPPTVASNSSPTSTPTAALNSTRFPAPSSVPSGTKVKIAGSTTMVEINQSLKQGFEGKFPGTTVTTTASGSDRGIQALLAGTADIAAVSRPLSTQEQNQGLSALLITNDAIALVVGKANPFTTGLTSTQVADIVTVHGGVHHAHRSQSLAKQKLWDLCA